MLRLSSAAVVCGLCMGHGTYFFWPIKVEIRYVVALNPGYLLVSCAQRIGDHSKGGRSLLRLSVRDFHDCREVPVPWNNANSFEP